MNLSEYQHVVLKWAEQNVPNYTSQYALTKLMEEVGELARCINKMEHSQQLNRTFWHSEAELELGDVISCVASIASSLDYNLDTVMTKHAKKLESITYDQSR